jgi:hypothetical protein
VRHWKTEIVVLALEMLSGRGKKEYAREAQAAAEPQAAAPAAPASGNGSAEPEEAVLAM